MSWCSLPPTGAKSITADAGGIAATNPWGAAAARLNERATAKKMKGQPVSSPVGPFYLCRRLGLSGPIHVCSAKENRKIKKNSAKYTSASEPAPELLSRRFRAWATQRATRQVFDRVRAALGHRHQRMAACGHALDGNRPTLMQ